MRKQTKLVAVLSTAALLAVGASMTSFAATGWAEENGTWVYYDRSGDLETEAWAKSGDNWFYLNDDGEMATDMVIEDDDKYYYVDENGAMVTNKWVSVENDEYDGDDDEPVNYWYYFQSNGKAMKGSDDHVSLKTINGKKYTFDDEGKMLYGWVDRDDAERITGDDAWQEGDYYFGDENDGSMTTGWLQLDIVDENANDTDEDTAFDDEDQVRWFYFKSSGKKMAGEKGKTINGKKYGFDEYGRMIAEWYQNGDTLSTSSYAGIDSKVDEIVATANNSHQYRYYGTPENGARYTKGWFQVVPAEGLNKKDYDDDEDNWYYSDKDGQLVVNEIKTINGKKYAFDEEGGMIDGLNFISVLKNDKKKIVTIHNDDYYDTEDEFEDFANANGNYFDTDEVEPNFYWNDQGADYITICYDFNEDNGDMVTGKEKVDIDGDDYDFSFKKSGSYKGAGMTEEDHDKYYLAGKLLKADKEDKYSVIKKTVDTSNHITKLELLTTDEYLNGATMVNGEPTGHTVDGAKYKKDNNYYYVDDLQNTATEYYYLVSTSGKIVTGDKSKAKDGSDICYQVENGEIVAVFEED